MRPGRIVLRYVLRQGVPAASSHARAGGGMRWELAAVLVTASLAAPATLRGEQEVGIQGRTRSPAPGMGWPVSDSGPSPDEDRDIRERPRPEDHRPTRFLFKSLPWVAAALSAALLTVHTFQWSQVQVDATSLALVGVLVVIPLVGYIRRLRIGDFEVELEALKRGQQRLGEVVADQIASDATEEDPSESEKELRGEEVPRLPSVRVRRPIRRILWVDDHPEGNDLEVSALARAGFIVSRVTSTRRALSHLGSDTTDALITDLVRDEDGQIRLEAGQDVIRAARDRQRDLPVFVYSSTDSVAAQGSALDELAITGATSSPTELIRMVTRTSALGLENEVMSILQASSVVGINVQTASGQLDAVIETAGRPRRIGIEIKHWAPATRGAAVAREAARLQISKESMELDSILLVTPSRLLSQAVTILGKAGIENVPVEDLRDHLALS